MPRPLARKPLLLLLRAHEGTWPLFFKKNFNSIPLNSSPWDMRCCSAFVFFLPCFFHDWMPRQGAAVCWRGYFLLWWQGGAGTEVPDMGHGSMLSVTSLEVEGDWDIASTRVLSEVLHSQKRPTVSKETYYSVKRDLLQCQKRFSCILEMHTTAYLVIVLGHYSSCN